MASSKPTNKKKASKSMESSDRFEQIESQNYATLKSQCQKSGNLFEDELFPAIGSSFYCKEPRMELKWLRPFQIKTSPKFFPDLSFPFKLNITQGKVGNFWYLGAISPLTTSKQLFEQVVPCGQTFDTPEYAGIFYFRLWNCGKWWNVIIDDRLPTIDGELIMAHDKEMGSFWCSLLEKAYAKLVGCYEALVGSYSSEAQEDFTGGLCETYHLKGKDLSTNLFSSIYKSILHSSLITCWLESDEKQPAEKQLENGLWQGHFYSITGVNSIELEEETNQIQLIRLRNICTNVPDWKGAWGLNSQEWQLIPDQDKERFGLGLEYGGEFWMTYEDFKANFTKIDICNLNKSTNAKFKWEIICHEGAWEPGISAGGCSTTKGPFNTNPRYSLTVSDKDGDPDDGNHATVIIGLMQKNRSSKKSTGLYDLKIGFQVYSLQKDLMKQKDQSANQFTNEYFQKNKPIAGTKCYINIRQVFGRFRLKPGNYIVIPSTFMANQKGSFLMRFFCEKNDTTTESEMSYSIKPKGDNESSTALFKVSIGQIKEKGNITSDKLHQTLGNVIAPQNINFTLDICRSLVAMYDLKREGFISNEQLALLCADLNECYTIFCANISSKDSNLKCEEIKKCFDQMGIYPSPSIIQIVLNRYGTDVEGQSPENKVKKRAIDFANFSVCSLKLRSVIIYWDIKAKAQYNESNSNTSVRGSRRILTFTLQEFVEQMMYS